MGTKIPNHARRSEGRSAGVGWWRFEFPFGFPTTAVFLAPRHENGTPSEQQHTAVAKHSFVEMESNPRMMAMIRRRARYEGKVDSFCWGVDDGGWRKLSFRSLHWILPALTNCEIMEISVSGPIH